MMGHWHAQAELPQILANQRSRPGVEEILYVPIPWSLMS